MDFTEKIFHYFIQKKQKEKQKTFESQAIAFQDFEKYAEVILQFFIKDIPFEVRSNDQYIGFIGQSFVLPRHFLVHQKIETNLQLLKYLILYQCFLIQYKLDTFDKKMSYQLRTIESLCLRPYILSKLKNDFPSTYLDFLQIEKELFQSEFLIQGEKQLLKEFILTDTHLRTIRMKIEVWKSSIVDELFGDQKKIKENGQFRSSIWQI